MTVVGRNAGRTQTPSTWNRGSNYVYDRQQKVPVKVNPSTGEAITKSEKFAGNDYLTRYERAGTIGSGRSLVKSGNEKASQATDDLSKAEQSLADYSKTAMADGELRRSERVEMSAGRMDVVAAKADRTAGDARALRGTVMERAAKDGVMTDAEDGRIDNLKGIESRSSELATDSRSKASEMRDTAATLRAGELRADIDRLKGITDVDKKRGVYFEARDAYNSAVDAAGGHGNLRGLPESKQLEIEGLGQAKSAAWKDLVAEHKKASLIRTAEGAMGDGKVTTAEQSGVDKQVRSINLMQAESDKLSNMSKSTMAQANTRKAVEAIQTGNVRELFGQPWGRQYMADTLQRGALMDMGFPFMSPQMHMSPFSPMARSVSDFDAVMMQQMQMQMLHQQLLGGMGMNQFPFGGGFDFSMMW